MLFMTGGRRVRRRVFVLAIAVATIGASLLTPGIAAADTYRWKNAVGGIWNVPANWVHTSGTSSVGYPNGQGDQADFPLFAQGHYLARIPANKTIVVGAISVGGGSSVTIAGDSGAKLIVASGSPQNALLVTFDSAQLALAVPVELFSDLLVLTDPVSTVEFWTVTEAAFTGAHAITKTGPGRLNLIRPASHSGGTRVQDGTLVLHANGSLVSGAPLEIGDGLGLSQSAMVVATGTTTRQFNSSGTVQVNRDGLLMIGEDRRIGHLQIRDGNVRLHHGDDGDPDPPFVALKLTLSTLSMTGGVLDIFGPPLPDTAPSELVLEGDVTATASALGPAIIGSGSATLNTLTATRTFTVLDGPGTIDLRLDVAVVGMGAAGLIKDGPGTLLFTGKTDNSYPGGTLVRQGTLELARPAGRVAVPGNLLIGVGLGPAIVNVAGGVENRENIAHGSLVTIGPGGLLRANSGQTGLSGLTIASGGRAVLGDEARAAWDTNSLTIAGGGRLTIAGVNNNGSLRLAGDLNAGGPQGTAVIDGGGLLTLGNAAHALVVAGGPQPIHLQVDAAVTGACGAGAIGRLIKMGQGVALFGTGSSLACGVGIREGSLLVNGIQTSGLITLEGGTLGGNGTMADVLASAGTLSPGLSPGRLSTGSLELTGNSKFVVELHGVTPGKQHDQVAVSRAVSLGNAKLVPSVGVNALFSAPVTIIENHGADPVSGTFAGLPEGSTLTLGGVELTLSYHGGDGNDVVLTEASVARPVLEPGPDRMTYGKRAPGAFVDGDAGVANANDAEAPGTRTRTVAKPAMRWIFAEGAQGHFDTYVSIANGHAEATTATLTFLREDESPAVHTVEVEPFARKTIYAGDFADVADRAFGLVVEATQPVLAERAMYYANLPNGLWTGGHVTTGIVAPATRWGLTEGRVGGPHAFSTYILLANPSPTAADVTITYLRENGEPIVKTYTVPAASRYNVDVKTVVPELRNASFGARIDVTNNVPIAVERSSYWNVNGVSLAGGSNAFATSQP
jgi:autotransporter-associated beta strand protein